MFILGSDSTGTGPVTLPPKAKHVDMPSLDLQIFAPLSAIPVYDPRGCKIGTFLGTVIDPVAKLVVKEKVVLPAVPETNFDGYIEREIYRFTGAFLFILDLPQKRRLYLDACGSMSAVWDPDTGRAAAISSQLLSEEELNKRFDSELYSALRVDRDGWFPAGLTAHQRIFRLMPNHYFDIDAKTAVRHWPQAPIPITDKPEAACGRILKTTRDSIAALAATGPISIALTAGNETRMLMAASRNLKGNLRFVTVSAQGAELDLTRAKELAEQFNLSHRVIALKLASATQSQEWQNRAAWSIGGPHVLTHPTVHQLRDRSYCIGGSAGEVGRGFFWRQSDTDETILDADGIWARMGMPYHPRGVAAVSGWLDALRSNLGNLPSLLVLDLAYLEIRMGCWGFALSYTNTAPTDIHPLIGRENFNNMLSLPPSWRRIENGTNPMIQNIITQGWPEILDFPIGRYGDWRDQASFLRRVATKPYLIVKKLRKTFS